MLRHYDTASPVMAARLRSHTRCLPDGADEATFFSWSSSTSDRSVFRRTYAQVFPDDISPPRLDSLRARALMSAMELREGMRVAWGEAAPGPVDCLFALERLGAPYRNIRGLDISAHTEPIDALWFVMTTLTRNRKTMDTSSRF